MPTKSAARRTIAHSRCVKVDKHAKRSYPDTTQSLQYAKQHTNHSSVLSLAMTTLAFMADAMFEAEKAKGRKRGVHNDAWLATKETPPFQMTSDKIKAEANAAVKSWLRHPAYKMTLSKVQEGADANMDGVIDREEFSELMKRAGYKGAEANALFDYVDKDKDGSLTKAEMKKLHQGSGKSRM